MSQNKYKITSDNIATIENELESFQELLHPLFKRKEQRTHSNNYLRGLLQPLPNKAIETMVLHMHGDDINQIRAMQHFVSEGSWDDRRVLQEHWRITNEAIGEEDGVLIIDDSGFPKQGNDSVGVKRQWCGQLGKTANCQVGVFAGYASDKGRTLLDCRLYLPEEWVNKSTYAERRQRCGVPSDVRFKTKPTLAADMVVELATKGAISFRWVTADEAYGRDSHFLDTTAKHAWYFAEIPNNTHVWCQRPETQLPAYKGRGRKPTLVSLVADAPQSQTVADVVSALQASDWQRQLIKEGTKGAIIADMLALRVIQSRNGLPSDEVWLICRRNITTDEIHYFLSNASEETSLETFARIAGMRWPVETCFEEGKQELGMGDYQLRSWTGWHHHMTFVILAHGFLMRVRHKLADAAPQLTLPQVILLLKAVLPQPEFSVESTVKIVNYYQDRHAAATRSHRKRRRRLDKLQQLE
ncbi:MAG: IS701 family transposase [Anaerolineales bacterium]|nr:IS701 family transposase [Anaerolineales bacterium]